MTTRVPVSVSVCLREWNGRESVRLFEVNIMFVGYLKIREGFPSCLHFPLERTTTVAALMFAQHDGWVNTTSGST